MEREVKLISSPPREGARVFVTTQIPTVYFVFVSIPPQWPLENPDSPLNATKEGAD